MARLYIARKKEHGGDHGNQYTVEVASSEPQNLAESKTVEVVAEGYVVEESKGQVDLLNTTTYEVVAKDFDKSPKPGGYVVEESTSQPDKLIEPWFYILQK